MRFNELYLIKDELSSIDAEIIEASYKHDYIYMSFMIPHWNVTCYVEYVASGCTTVSDRFVYDEWNFVLPNETGGKLFHGKDWKKSFKDMLNFIMSHQYKKTTVKKEKTDDYNYMF